MKKNFTILVILLLAGSSFAMAQPLKIGLKGGINTGSYSFATVGVNDAKISAGSSNGIGYHMGIVARLSIPKFLQIQPELLYSVSDQNYGVTTTSVQTTVKMRTKRIELPVMVGFNIAALRIYAGPRFVLSSSEKSNNESIPLKIKSTSDVAFQVGAGLDIKKFFIDVRYSTYFKSRFEQFSYNGVTQKVKINTDEQWFFSAGFFF